ncbi:RNA 2'-phosphotransferase [candidate division KSB1 bacterium]|nr:RNA 2'-phosphotransferase [candidate division KSB1 bacterium]
MNHKIVKTSKYLSYILRHRPEKINLVLDENGWADIDELILRANRAGVELDKELLFQVVEKNDKQRFALSEDRRRIRASQGHSIRVNLNLEPRTPPEFLYHGTASRFLQSIKTHGLLPGNRTHVHLSPDKLTATHVGNRHGVPVVLTVQAEHMHKNGHSFYLSDNGIWLTEKVPVEYIFFPG